MKTNLKLARSDSWSLLALDGMGLNAYPSGVDIYLQWMK
jgi:hypothetical protein